MRAVTIGGGYEPLHSKHVFVTERPHHGGQVIVADGVRALPPQHLEVVVAVGSTSTVSPSILNPGTDGAELLSHGQTLSCS